MRNDQIAHQGWKHRMLGLALLLLGTLAAAETATVTRYDHLRDQAFLDSEAGTAVTPQSKVVILEVRGAWARVKAKSGEGWIRVTSIKRHGATGPVVSELALAGGRNSVTEATASLGIRGAPLGGGTPHALIMTVSNYKGGVPELPGVKWDAAKAADIAKSMGVDPANMEFLKDEQMTVEGIDNAINKLVERINPGDSAFIYYSGHGGRTIVLDPKPRCAETLVTVTGDSYVDTRLQQQLQRISQKAGKVIAFFDACHSGGVTTRSGVGARAQFRSKSWSKSDTETCVRPVNVITRSLQKSSTPGSGTGNYVYIAAARDNEVALDHPSKGGIATSAWKECIAGSAVDKDGSGGLSAIEIQDCAQEKIEDAVRGNMSVLPHHVTIAGNVNAVLAFSRGTSGASPVLAASLPAQPATSQVPTPFAAAPPPGSSTPPLQTTMQIIPSPAPSKPLAPASATPLIPTLAPPLGPAATLNDLYSNRDDRRVVKVSPENPILKVGLDKLSFSVTSSHAGYLYVLMAGSDGSGFDLLFPNQLDQSNMLAPGEILELPRSSWEVTAGGPAGTDTLLVLVSEAPRNFKSLPLKPTGPFSAIESSVVNAKDIQLVFGGGTPATAECKQESARRNLAVAQRCSTSYGAALLSVREVD